MACAQRVDGRRGADGDRRSARGDSVPWFIRLTPLTARQAVESSRLPGDLHDDPADRLLAATGRDLDACLVTRDARLLAYGEAGHLQVLAC